MFQAPFLTFVRGVPGPIPGIHTANKHFYFFETSCLALCPIFPETPCICYIRTVRPGAEEYLCSRAQHQNSTINLILRPVVRMWSSKIVTFNHSCWCNVRFRFGLYWGISRKLYPRPSLIYNNLVKPRIPDSLPLLFPSSPPPLQSPQTNTYYWGGF